MKKTLLPILLILITSSISAQKKKIEYGFQGGININSLFGTNISKDTKGNTTGLSIGANAKWNKTDRFGIRVQLSYEQFGWALKNLYLEDSVNGIVKTDILVKLNYLHLPVLASYSFGKKIKFILEAGGFAGILLSNKVTQKRPFSYGGQPTEFNYSSSNYRMINAGLAASVGVQIPLTSTLALDLNARNYTGLTNTSKIQSGFSSSPKTMTFSFLTGLSFQL